MPDRPQPPEPVKAAEHEWCGCEPDDASCPGACMVCGVLVYERAAQWPCPGDFDTEPRPIPTEEPAP